MVRTVTDVKPDSSQPEDLEDQLAEVLVHLAEDSFTDSEIRRCARTLRQRLEATRAELADLTARRDRAQHLWDRAKAFLFRHGLDADHYVAGCPFGADGDP